MSGVVVEELCSAWRKASRVFGSEAPISELKRFARAVGVGGVGGVDIMVVG